MSTADLTMTKSQEREVERLIVDFFAHTSLGRPEKYELKRLDILETKYKKIIVVIEAGMKGDEGTIASLLCRIGRQYFIGPRGGVTWYVGGKSTKGKYYSSRFHDFNN